METTAQNLTLTQKVAILWLRNVDRGLSIYKMLQTMPQAFRYIFYTGLIAFTILGMIFLSTFIPKYDNALWQLLGDTVFYGVAIGIILVVTVESVLKLNVAQIFTDDKSKKDEIKAKKLQKWRLRNMNIWSRIFIYISFYLLCYFIIQISAQGAFITIFGAADMSNPEVQKQINLFLNEYNSLLQWFTFLYIISGLSLDYFVSKNRAKQAQKEVQDEIL